MFLNISYLLEGLFQHIYAMFPSSSLHIMVLNQVIWLIRLIGFMRVRAFIIIPSDHQ